MPLSKLELLEKIAGGENLTVEFKEDVSQRSDTAGEMIAFANTHGGWMLMGITDDGQVVGVSQPDDIATQITNIARHNCRPPLNPLLDYVDVDGKTVVVVEIPRRLGPPHENNSGQCYVRVDSTKQLATTQERARLLQQAGLFAFDETPVPGTGLDDLDLATFRAYYESFAGESLDEISVPLPRFLTSSRLVRPVNGQLALTVAGLLVFGKRPQQVMRHSRISAVRFIGPDAGEEIADRQEIEGRLPQLIDAAEAFLARNTSLSGSIKGFQRTDRSQYPREALREAVVNAVAHRDYSIAGAQIRLLVFDESLEVRSPGTLPNTMTLETIRFYNHASRNDLVTQFLSRMGYMKDFGTGIPRMIRLMKQHNDTEPEFELQGHEFVVRLRGET